MAAAVQNPSTGPAEPPPPVLVLLQARLCVALEAGALPSAVEVRPVTLLARNGDIFILN